MTSRIEIFLKSYQYDQNRLNHKVNISQFWKTMKTSSPELTKLVNVVLRVPATQIIVECIFSGLKFISPPYRSNISNRNVKDILLIRTNM